MSAATTSQIRDIRGYLRYVRYRLAPPIKERPLPTHDELPALQRPDGEPRLPPATAQRWRAASTAKYGCVPTRRASPTFSPRPSRQDISGRRAEPVSAAHGVNERKRAPSGGGSPRKRRKPYGSGAEEADYTVSSSTYRVRSRRWGGVDRTLVLRGRTMELTTPDAEDQAHERDPGELPSHEPRLPTAPRGELSRRPDGCLGRSHARRSLGAARGRWCAVLLLLPWVSEKLSMVQGRLVVRFLGSRTAADQH